LTWVYPALLEKGKIISASYKGHEEHQLVAIKKLVLWQSQYASGIIRVCQGDDNLAVRKGKKNNACCLFLEPLYADDFSSSF
jgi:hypothetical protein